MDQALEEVLSISREVDLDVIQLHGKEDSGFVDQLQKQLPEAWTLDMTKRWEHMDVKKQLFVMLWLLWYSWTILIESKLY